MKTFMAVLAVFGLMQTASADATAYFALDCRAGARECPAKGKVEVLCYDARWLECGETVRLTDNGTLVEAGVAGSYDWAPASESSLPHLLKLEILSGGQVVRTETALFAKGGAVADATALFPLDCRAGVRDCATKGEVLRYDAGWIEGGEAARLTDNGTPVVSGISGEYRWCLAADDVTTHVLELEILSGGNIVRTETAEFSNAYQVIFDANGGTGTMPSLACLRGRIYGLHKCGFKNAGQSFRGWLCTNGRRYDDGMLVFNLAQPGETVTMTAIWE